jgi:putative lipoprotein
MHARTYRAFFLACSLCVWVGASRVRAQSDDPWFGQDKLWHFSLEVGISGAAYALSVPLVEPAWQRALIAGGMGLSVGIAKELYDATGMGDPSLRDLTWDVLGCAVGVGLALLLDLSLRGPARAPPGSAVMLRF